MKVTFSTIAVPRPRPATTEASAASAAAPISPPTTSPYPQGAAVPAHRSPSFGAPVQSQSTTNVDKGPVAYSSAGEKIAVKDPPRQKHKPPPVIKASTPQGKAPATSKVDKQPREESERPRSRSKNKIPREASRRPEQSRRPDPPKKYINIPSEKYIYVHKYVYICVYTYLCKMDEYRSHTILS